MFKLPILNYDYGDLESFLSEDAFEVHYTGHHSAYTDKLNATMEKDGVVEKDLKNVFKEIEKYSDAILNNAGGYWNHNFFWESLSTGGEEISEQVLNVIENSFESFDNFKSEFGKKALSLFGSGWTWLVFNKESKKLEILNTANQENPLMSIIDGEYEPILVLDIWEHSYYVDYKNKRADYVNNFWNFVNWKEVGNRIAKTES